MSWPAAVLCCAILLAPSVALEAGEASKPSAPAAEPATGIRFAALDAGTNPDLVTANIVLAGHGGQASAQQTQIGGQGWHLVFAGQK